MMISYCVFGMLTLLSFFFFFLGGGCENIQQRGASPQTQQVLLPYHSCPYTWDDLSLPRRLVVESLVKKSTVTSTRQSFLAKMVSTVGGLWSMLWEQTFSSSLSSKSRSVRLGYFELDRLQPSAACVDLPHITVGVHADGPTRVLSVVDARNKPQSADKQQADPHTAAPFDMTALPDAWWTSPASRLQAKVDGEHDLVDLIMYDESEDEDIDGIDSEDAGVAFVSRGASLSVSEFKPTSRQDEVGQVKKKRNAAQGQTTNRRNSSASFKMNTRKGGKNAEGPQGKASFFEAQLVLKGIGLSLVESAPRRELMYLSVVDFCSEYGTVDDQSRLVIKVGWVQADNQLYGAYYPVMLAPRTWNRAALSRSVFISAKERKHSSSLDDDENSAKEDAEVKKNLFRPQESREPSGQTFAERESGLDNIEVRPFAELCLMSSNKFPSLDFVRYVSMLVLPMNLKLEPELLSALLGFVSRCLAVTGSAARHRMNVGTRERTSLPSAMMSRSLNQLLRKSASIKVAYPGATRDVILSGGRVASKYSMLASSDAAGADDDSDSMRDEASLLRASPLPSVETPRSGSTGVSSSLVIQGIGAELRPEERSSTPTTEQTREAQSSSSAGVGSFPVSNRKLYIEELHIHPVKVHVSFSFRSSSIPIRMLAGVPDTSSFGGENNSINPLRYALNSMGATLANVENAPLRLNALVLHNVLTTRETIMDRILGHYRSQALRQAYLILGSVDLLGDPRGLVQNLGAGVLDFFYEPALGLVRSPKDFGAGIAKGTISLFRRVVLGAATSATGFANGVSTLFESLSNDRFTDFKPKSVSEGVIQGIAGLVVAPMNALLDEGLIGLGPGLFYGCIGLFVKPMAGVLKIVKHVLVAIQSTVDPTVKYRWQRVRPPRSFQRIHQDQLKSLQPNRLLEEYDYYQALGEEVLAMVDHGKFLGESHVAHISLKLPVISNTFGTDKQPSEDTIALPSSIVEEARGKHGNDDIAVSLAQKREAERADFLFSYYTLHAKRPWPKLALWKKMFLVATRFHLIYAPALPGEYERSVWSVPLASIQDVQVSCVEQVVEEDDEYEPGTMHTSTQEEKSNPNLVYWVTTISRESIGASAMLPEPVIVYSWTEQEAARVREFCTNFRYSR